MLMVLAKLGSPEEVGQFALSLAITAPVITFASLFLRGVQATDAKDQYRFGDYLALRISTTVLALLTIAGIVFLTGYKGETALVILVVGLAKACEAISDVLYGLLQKHERMDRIAKSMMIKGPLSLIALSLGVYLTGSVVWGAIGLALVWALILVGYDIRNGVWILASPQTWPSRKFAAEAAGLSKLRPHWSITTLRSLVRLTLPLGFVMLLISLNPNIPRYFVVGYLGERELGIFAAMAYIMVAGDTVVGALGQSAVPRLAKYYAEGMTEAFNALLLKLVGIGALLGVMGVLVVLVAGSEILTLLYGPEYATHVDVFVWLMVAAGIQYAASLLGYGMSAARYFTVQMPLMAGVAAVTTIACMGFIPYVGLSGAALAMVTSAVFMLAGAATIIKYAISKNSGRKG
jgi:O-antigen/teichoic acid export membrane protein